MAFPPNYKQERSNRERAKAQKLQDKEQKREEKAAQRKAGRDTEPGDNTGIISDKEPT